MKIILLILFNMPKTSLLSMLFGAKHKTTKKKKAKRGKKKKSSALKIEGKKPPSVLLKKAKKLGVRVTTGRPGHRVYKKVSVLTKQVKQAEKKGSPKRRRRSNRFGSGNPLTLASIMSPVSSTGSVPPYL